MTPEEETLVRHRLERAWETLAEADVMAKSGHWNACVNRLYYACFYAVTALLFQRSLSASKHAGVRALFNQHIINTGLVAPDLGALYNKLFDQRLRGDYRDFVRFDDHQVRAWRADTQHFVEQIAELIWKQAPTGPGDSSAGGTH